MHLSLFFPPEALVGGDPVEDTLGISEKNPYPFGIRQTTEKEGWEFRYQGPVVQSIVSLTSSLVVK